MAGKEHTIVIYRITSPSNRQYVGITSQKVQERWRQHCAKAKRGYQHPLAAAIRKYGPRAFTVEILSEHKTWAEGKEAEVLAISVLENRYNLSPGGEDGIVGVQKLRELLQDPVWRADYCEKLSAGIKASKTHNNPEALAQKTAALALWREKNPREAYVTQRRASRCAKRKATIAKKQRKEKAPNRMQSVLRRKRAVSKVWASRSPEIKQAISRKISVSVKEHHERKTDGQKEEHNHQLKEARKNINHDVRKARQKEAIKTYWTPERREAFGALVRKRWEKKRENI